MKHYILYVLSCLLALTASLPLSAQELRDAPSDVIMPLKVKLDQPHPGKGSFKLTGDHVANGFALPETEVTLELKPNTDAGYTIDESLIKFFDLNGSACTMEGGKLEGNTYTFTMPKDLAKIEVEFMKTLTIIPDEKQVVYADEEITKYVPTYTVEGITEADGNVVFTGNLKVGGEDKIVNDNLSAVNYTLEVTPDVTVERLTDEVSDVVDKPLEWHKSVDGKNGWYKSGPITLLPPTGFLIKQTSAPAPTPTPAPASLALRDAADAEEYVAKLPFSDEGEHTIHYNLKRIGMDNKIYEGKSISYKLDYSLPTYNISVRNRTATVTLADQVSGLASCTYQWDRDREQSVTGFTAGDKEATITLTGSAGAHHLSLTLKDMAGNELSESDISVVLENPYIPPVNPDPDDGDDDNPGGDDNGDPEPEPDPDPIDPVANEAIQAAALGIYVDNGKLCLRLERPCQVLIYTFGGSLQHRQQLPAGKTRLYDLPAGQYIVRLSAPHLPQGELTRKVRVW